MLAVYQSELSKDMATKPDATVGEEITMITDIWFRVQRCTVRATGKSMEMMVLRERARCLNLTNLSDMEEEDMVDMQIVPDCVLGTTLA